MKTLRSLSTRRVAFLSGLALLIGLCAWTALAGSIPANLTINFDGLGFVDNTNTMTNVFTSGDFTFTVSASDWIQGAGAFCDGGSGGCLNASGSGLETITIQTTS